MMTMSSAGTLPAEKVIAPLFESIDDPRQMLNALTRIAWHVYDGEMLGISSTTCQSCSLQSTARRWDRWDRATRGAWTVEEVLTVPRQSR